MSMHFDLHVENEPTAVPVVRAFLGEAMAQTSLPPSESEAFLELVMRGAHAAVEYAYPEGENGPIEIGFAERRGKLTITVRDRGLPVDVEELEARLHGAGGEEPRLFGIACHDAADEIHWVGYGPEGKALCFTRWLPDAHVTSRSGDEALDAIDPEVPLAPEQDYEIRRLQPEDALAVSRLMYRTYGGTYFNRDVYYPDRIIEVNEREEVLSFVAVGEDGSVAGHLALERNQPGPVAETGQAIVHPAHRGRGLLARMHKAMMGEVPRLGLVGLYADAVTVHPLTQKSQEHHGARLCGVDLGISPKTERFHGFGGELPQRVTCMLYLTWLRQPAPRTVYLPERHRELAQAIYDNLGCSVEFGREAVPEGHGLVTAALDADAARAFVRVDRVGADSAASIRHARRDFVEHAHAEVVFAELPLGEPGTPAVVEELEEDGFAFAGIAPHFARGGDLLRLVYLTELLEREPIATFSELAGRVVDYALAEQARVRQAV